MLNQNKRPVHLNLFQIKLPIAGVMSIMHRVSGAVLALCLPGLLYYFSLALKGQGGFTHVLLDLHTFPAILIIFLVIWAFMHHLLAGIRYLLLDIDIGIEKPMFRQTAWLVIILAPVLTSVIVRGLL